MARGIPRTAQNNPVILRGPDSQDHDVGQSNERTLRSTGPADQALEPSVIVKVSEQPYDDEKMAMLKFMAEPIEIRIGTTTDKNAEQCFEININGRLEFFRRGETKTVPRYVVDRLLRLKQTVYTQKEVVNAEGVKDIVNIPHTALKYDYAITRDDNPLGKSWERSVLAEIG